MLLFRIIESDGGEEEFPRVPLVFFGFLKSHGIASHKLIPQQTSEEKVEEAVESLLRFIVPLPRPPLLLLPIVPLRPN